MSAKVETWRVEALEPRKRCNLILEVRASTEALAHRAFFREARKWPTAYGVADSTWPIIECSVMEEPASGTMAAD